MGTKISKGTLAFLRKVEARQVYRTRGYTRRKGGYETFSGGEATYNRLLPSGLINRAPTPSLGIRGFVTLTEAGRAALEAAE